MPTKVVEGKVVDSYRFAGPTAKVLRAAIPQEPQYDFIPWTPLRKPRVLEAAGISTLCINMIPDYSRAYGFPRVAALEYPFGLPLGRPKDQEGQLQVIRAALRALKEIKEPGGVVHLPFEWPEAPERVPLHPPEPFPIAKLMAQGKVADPVGVLGQGRWQDLGAIVGRAPKSQARAS